MRDRPCPLLEQGRVRTGPMASDVSYGNNGAFSVQSPTCRLIVIASNGMGWEHVSVRPAKEKRCPTWDEMHFVKTLFWRDDECVVQFHPPQSEYVNMHQHVLHLWKPLMRDMPMPPVWMV